MKATILQQFRSYLWQKLIGSSQKFITDVSFHKDVFAKFRNSSGCRLRIL